MAKKKTGSAGGERGADTALGKRMEESAKKEEGYRKQNEKNSIIVNT